MRRRLRKKRRLGEFREYIFWVEFETEPFGEEDGLDFLMRFLETGVEANGLVCSVGGQNTRWSGYIDKPGRGSTTPEHQRAIESWLVKEPVVKRYAIGPLIDGWHGPFDDDPQLPLIEKSSEKRNV